MMKSAGVELTTWFLKLPLLPDQVAQSCCGSRRDFLRCGVKVKCVIFEDFAVSFALPPTLELVWELR